VAQLAGELRARRLARDGVQMPKRARREDT